MYAGDMHALEQHMLEAFERQVSITKDYAEAHAVVLDMVITTKRHIAALHRLVSYLGDLEKIVTDKLKTAMAGLFGMAAGIVDTVRPLAVSKAFRDSYTAIHHAIVGYVMLNTTALALQSEETRILADDFLNEWIDLSHRVLGVIPGLVIRDLMDEGIQLYDFKAAQEVKDNESFSVVFRRERPKEEEREEREEKKSSQVRSRSPKPSHEARQTAEKPVHVGGLKDIMPEKPGKERHPSPKKTHETSETGEKHAQAALHTKDATPLPSKIIVEKTRSGEHRVITSHVDPTVVEHVVKPTIVKESFHPEKIVEVQPVIHREIQAPEVHHIKKHVYEKVEVEPTVFTNQPIIEEVIKPHIVEEVQEIVHRELPAPFIEKVENLTEEVEIMPTIHTKEVIRERKEHIVQADVVVRDVAESERMENVSETEKTKAKLERLDIEEKGEEHKKPGVSAGGPMPTKKAHKKNH